jgi:hypothetical protein
VAFYVLFKANRFTRDVFFKANPMFSGSGSWQWQSKLKTLMSAALLRSSGSGL